MLQGGRSATKGGRSAMLQIFRGGGGRVCNVADLPGGRSAIQHRHIYD